MSEELDPSEFVNRIRQLGEQRDQQDAERVRKLEEEIIQGRSERLARRAERARSLSPDKPTTPQSLPSTADTPQSVQEKAAEIPTPAMEPPSQQSAQEDSLQHLTGSPAQALEDDEPKKPAPSAAALRRSGTLSWQRRPQSGTGSVRRPLSMAAGLADRSGTSSPRDTPEPSSPERPLSRNQIAQSLGAKDPSWFKQTPDRGIGSAAYRRNQEDNASDAGSISGRRQLPGMSRDSTAEPEATSPPPESARSASPSQPDSARGSAASLSNRFSASTSISSGDTETGKVKSPLPVLDSQKLPPPSDSGSVDGGDQASSARPLAMSPTQGRISPERPASPTKGMGGFVQSAMLKRSDSVSKRWSTQTPPGLSRQNSTLSNRGSTYGTLAKADARPSSLSRGNSMEPSPRPGSSSSNLTITQDAADKASTPKDEFVKPALPRHSRSKSVASTFSEDGKAPGEASPPSPSKRWSPTKSSWLENALKKPESPKLAQPPSQQPSWMTEINRIKQQRGSVDLGKGSPLTSPLAEGSISGRISPIKDVQLKPVGLRKIDPIKKEETAEPVKPSPKPKPAISPEPPAPAQEETKEPDKEDGPEKEGLDKEELEKEGLEKEGLEKEGIEKEEPDIKADAPQESSDASETASQAKPVPSTSRLSKDSPLSPPATKPKPQTPPKKDFRAGLRSRQNTSEAPKDGEVSELQSVFGRLKKTETKNFVAPDTFKDNILRGKSALTITGGPKPSVRRDEFRDSLISQKSAMLAKAKETGSAAHKRADSSSQPPTMPEAIAKRKALGRSDSISKLPSPTEKEATPEAISRKQSLRASKPIIPEKVPQATTSLSSKGPVKSSKLADRFNPALAGMLARGPPPMTSKPASNGDSSESVPAQPVEEEKKGPAPELTHMTKGRARGPKRRAPAAKQTGEKETKKEFSTPSKVAQIATVPLVKTEDILPSNELSRTDKEPEDLTMQTPARDSFKTKPTTPAKPPVIATKVEKSPTPEPPRKPASLELGARVLVEVKETPEKSPEKVANESSPASSSKVASWKPSKPLPTLPPKPETQKEDESSLRSVDQTPVNESPKTSAPKTTSWRSSRPLPTPPPKVESQKEPNTALEEIPTPNIEVPLARESHSPDKPTFSVKSATALWGRQPASSSPVPSRTKSPIKLPTRADEQAAMEDAGLVHSVVSESRVEPKPLPPKPKPTGLGLGLGSFGGFVASRSRSRESSPSIPASTKATPISPPLSGGRPLSVPFKASHADDPFAEYFDEPPVTSDELPENINTIQILKSPPIDLGSGGKIRTLRKQMQEITGDGKLSPIPMQEEHVLYQDTMYLCTHVYDDANGVRTTEVYLWAGNGVAESTLEDAQLFGRNFAKQSQGKLIILRQGNEPPNFFEALGGIVITRRGSQPAAKEYMLCGRRHLGHIAFDEVDFSLKSLYSGFPYLVTTDAGKVFLWKGRGCSAEELSAARLMGMDLTATGELIEVEEAAEPQAFMNTFPPADPSSKLPPIPQSAAFWRYKATSERYRTRLFKMEQQQGPSSWGQLQTPTTPKSPLPQITTKVVEIMPYCQRDLEPEYIYVLDAFFEMYIIVGALSRSQSSAFSTALMFAQEYSMIAVSEEDRPFMPVATVVLEGVPRDMKAVFRFWDDVSISTAALMRGKLGRGKSLRMMGLNKAIEATRR